MPDLDSLSRDDLIRLILELTRQNEDLRKQIEDLRRKDKRSAAPFSKGERKKNPKRPGRKPGQGTFTRRPEPPADAQSAPPVDVSVEEARCPFCGGTLEPEGSEEASVTDMPPAPEPEVRLFKVHVCRCRKCGRKTRGKHPDVAADQYGATAHRLGPRIKAMAHSLHYGHGVPVRRLPTILGEMTGITITQSAITQHALKQAEGPVGAAYRELREQVRQAPVAYTDDTGWRVGGDGAYLMAFDTDQETVYQIRRLHGNEQVREVIPSDYGGTLVTDRFTSYEAEELTGVEQHKCISHLIRNVVEVVESKTGRAKAFGSQLKTLLQSANDLWRQQRAGEVPDYADRGEQIEEELTYLLRPRRLRDADNQRLLDGIGRQHDRQRVLNFLTNPEVEPTNNRAERVLRPAVIARKVSHCSKNERGAEAFAAYHGVWLKADGTVWACGGNGYGELGTEGDNAYKPVLVPGLAGVPDIAAGDHFSAAVKNDGTLWTWGENADGELGNGTTKDSPKPARVASLDGVSAVAAGGRHILALRSDGTVWEWGKVSVGPHPSLPKRVEDFVGAVAIAASDKHSVALESDGTVWIWGDHGAGDLGNGSYGLAAAPMQLRGLSDITAIAAGYQLTVALKKDGTVWCVGYGAAGQLGNGSKENSTKPVMVSGLTGVKAVAAGYMHALALKDDGTVWSWGYNHEHQLGNPRVNAEESPKPVRSGTLSGAVAIGAAASHSAAITSQGAAWARGQNDGGSLGADAESLQRSDVPMRVGTAVPGECNPLFSCSTASGKVIRICGTQDLSHVDQWSDQYRFGPETGPSELVFPRRSLQGAAIVVFLPRGAEGRLSSYRSFLECSIHLSDILEFEIRRGSEVEDAKGKALCDIQCNERPYMFIDYMRMNLPCDPKNPHGAAACKESPYSGK